MEWLYMYKKYFLMLAIFLFAQCAHAQLLPVRYIMIHGWWEGMDCTTENCTTWPDTNTLNYKVYVNWNTSQDWRKEGVSRLKTTLNDECRWGSTRCVIVCHSTGCAITGKLLDMQHSWPVEKVLALGSAEGGSEVAELASGIGMGSGLQHITPSIVRNAYDHNDTGGVPFIHLAGYDSGGSAAATILPGQDDGTVAFHSACAYSQVFSSTWCSNDYTWVWRSTWYGAKYVQRGVAQWSNHARSEYCGRDGCNKTHMQLTQPQFQDQAKVEEPVKPIEYL
jgi:predicted alpha/beta hydrolase family esterase